MNESEMNVKGTPESQALARKKKSYKARGIIMLILGSLFAMGAVSASQSMSSTAEAIGGWSVPICLWICGLFFFLKSGGKIV